MSFRHRVQLERRGAAAADQIVVAASIGNRRQPVAVRAGASPDLRRDEIGLGHSREIVKSRPKKRGLNARNLASACRDPLSDRKGRTRSLVLLFSFLTLALSPPSVPRFRRTAPIRGERACGLTVPDPIYFSRRARAHLLQSADRDSALRLVTPHGERGWFSRTVIDIKHRRVTCALVKIRSRSLARPEGYVAITGADGRSL